MTRDGRPICTLHSNCKLLCTHVQEPSACQLGALPQTPIRAFPWTTLATSDPPVHVAPLPALSGNECLCLLWFSNDVCSSPNSWRITNQSPFLVLQEFGTLQVTKGMDSWLRDTDKNFGPDLPLLFKMHEI